MNSTAARAIPEADHLERIAKDIEELNTTWLLLAREYSLICPEAAAVRFGMTVEACRELARISLAELQRTPRKGVVRFIPRDVEAFGGNTASRPKRPSVPVLAAVSRIV